MNTNKLLSRDEFREAVFARDNHKCVLCKAPAQDAHHIMERRLFSDGGYYLNNGASVCGPCHIKCEATDIALDDIRDAAGITKPIIPEHLYSDSVYDKWGNIFIGNTKWLRGELFNDESVQKIIKNKLPYFVQYVKYPRTHHLPWSENITDDDRVISADNLESLLGSYVVVTEKMDGENTTMYRDYIHARSIDSGNHESRNWVKNFWSNISGDIPEGWRICGENMYAEHSIGYDKLPSYFIGFSIWNEKNVCLTWDETLYWFDLLGITPARELYKGSGHKFKHSDVWNSERSLTSEGYVMRNTHEFPYQYFRIWTAKYVRKDHVQTVKHWMHGKRMKINHLA